MPTTIKDVAKLANVSPSTVSRVISNNPKISDATKVIVREAMEQLKYRPNLIARSLTNKTTKTLALLLPGSDEDFLQNPFFVKAMRGISNYAKKQGYYILFTHPEKNEDEVNLLSDLLHSKWVDGVILTTVKDNDERIAFLKKYDLPFVVIGRPDDELNDLWVDNDNVSAMYNVVDMLIKRGHKIIAFIGGSHEFKVTKNRLLGYLKALKSNNIAMNLNIIQERDFTEEAAYAATREIFKNATPDAIVTTDDLIAFGSQQYMLEHDIQNVAIIGFNNTLLSEYKIPSISSIDINAEKLGVFAAKLLIDKLNNEKISTNSYLIETKFIERDSTK